MAPTNGASPTTVEAVNRAREEIIIDPDSSKPNTHETQDAADIGLVAKPIDAIVHDGQAAWSRLKTCPTWADWARVAAALDVGRTQAMLDAHTNAPTGRAFNEASARWLAANGFDSIHKSTRCQLLQCWERREAIEAWRKTLPLNERLRLNHPDTVLRRFEKTNRAAGAAPKQSYAAKLKAAVVELSEENAVMKREIARGGGDLWTPKDTAKDIAAVIAAAISPSKALAVARELSRLAREREVPQ